jgi:hypothetical protein
VSSGYWSISSEVKRPGYEAEYSRLQYVELCLHSFKRPLGMVFDIRTGVRIHTVVLNYAQGNCILNYVVILGKEILIGII